jgi:hypothetical protein
VLRAWRSWALQQRAVAVFALRQRGLGLRSLLRRWRTFAVRRCGALVFLGTACWCSHAWRRTLTRERRASLVTEFRTRWQLHKPFILWRTWAQAQNWEAVRLPSAAPYRAAARLTPVSAAAAKRAEASHAAHSADRRRRAGQSFLL